MGLTVQPWLAACPLSGVRAIASWPGVRIHPLIQSGTPAPDAAKQAFGDLKVLEKDLDKYRGRDTLPTRIIPASMIKVGDVQVRTLSPKTKPP